MLVKSANFNNFRIKFAVSALNLRIPITVADCPPPSLFFIINFLFALSAHFQFCLPFDLLTLFHFYQPLNFKFVLFFPPPPLAKNDQ